MLKTNKIIFVAAILLVLLIPVVSFAQQGSNIVITRTPYLSFTDTPDSFEFADLTVPTETTPVYSDPLVAALNPGARGLLISDTRNCGGFNLQAVASGDLDAGTATAIPDEGFRIVSSTEISASLDALTNPDDHVLYLSGYTGPAGSGGTPVIITPVYTASTAFGTATTFTDVSNNTLDNTVDIMQASLTSPTGRSGTMAVVASFYLEIPAYTQPGDYFTTITYTLTDATTGVCP